ACGRGAVGCARGARREASRTGLVAGPAAHAAAPIAATTAEPTAATAAAAESTARPRVARRAPPRFPHVERATLEGPPVELLDGALGVGAVRHLDEAEAARTARLAVGHDLCRRALTDLPEVRLEVLARGLIRQIPYKQLSSHFSLLWPAFTRAV